MTDKLTYGYKTIFLHTLCLRRGGNASYKVVKKVSTAANSVSKPNKKIMKKNKMDQSQGNGDGLLQQGEEATRGKFKVFSESVKRARGNVYRISLEKIRALLSSQKAPAPQPSP